jgi:hypothetical protein
VPLLYLSCCPFVVLSLSSAAGERRKYRHPDSEKPTTPTYNKLMKRYGEEASIQRRVRYRYKNGTEVGR